MALDFDYTLTSPYASDTMATENSARIDPSHHWSIGQNAPSLKKDLVEGLADLGDIDRTGILTSKIQTLEQIARDSVASGHENDAIEAIRLLAESTGFVVEQKR